MDLINIIFSKINEYVTIFNNNNKSCNKNCCPEFIIDISELEKTLNIELMSNNKNDSIEKNIFK